MAVNLAQLFKTNQEIANPANWKKVTPKAFKAYITLLPVDVKVKNKAFGVEFNVPKGHPIVCRPYGDIRIVTDMNLYRDSEGRTGKELLTAHGKKHCINGCHEPQSVLPWTVVTCMEPMSAPAKVAIKLDVKNIHNIIVDTNITLKQFNGQPVIANNSSASIHNGYGDYLVANAQAGPNQTYIPDFNTLDIVNGRTFTEMFDMRTFVGQNIETDVDAYIKPAELVEFTSLVRKSAYDLITEFTRKNGLKIKNADTVSKTLSSLEFPVDENNIPLLNETTEQKKIARPVTIDIQAVNNPDATLRIVLKDYSSVKQLLLKAARKATLFNKNNIVNLDCNGEYMSLQKSFDVLNKVR